MAEITATPGHNGGIIQAAVGDILTVRLPENPTTGYRWSQVEEADLSTPMACIGNQYEPPDAGALGARGTRAFRFALLNRGHAQAQFSLTRTWEHGLAPRETYTLSVEIA